MVPPPIKQPRGLLIQGWHYVDLQIWDSFWHVQYWLDGISMGYANFSTEPNEVQKHIYHQPDGGDVDGKTHIFECRT